MLLHWQRNRQSADRAEVPLWPLVPLTLQLLVFQLCDTLLTSLLVLLAMYFLAVHAAVFYEAAGRAVLELDGAAPVLAAVRAGFVALVRNNRRAVHFPLKFHAELRQCAVRFRLWGTTSRHEGLTTVLMPNLPLSPSFYRTLPRRKLQSLKRSC